jgi:hypothetical protein
MAENKKGFLLYADQKDIFDELPDDYAGKLIKHIFKYVNDENPESSDLILRVAFAPIKAQLKRDLVKYKDTCVGRSEAGRLGGIKSGEARRTKAKQNEANEASALKSKQNEHDIDNDIVIDTVKDKVIKIKKPSGIYFSDDELNNLFLEHLKIRSKIKAVNSDKAISGLVSKLNSISGDVMEQKQIVEQSIVSSWKSYFPLKNNNNGQIDEAQRRFNKLENLGSSFIPEIKGR